MKNKKADALISWIMIILTALVSSLITTNTPFYISMNTAGIQNENAFIQKRIEVVKKKLMEAKIKIEARKKLFMETGIYTIKEFFNPNSHKYFGIKLNSFYEEANLKRVKSIIEEQAKAQGRNTKDVMNEVTAREFIKYVFGDLDQELKNIASNYNNQIKLDEKLMAEISSMDVAIVIKHNRINIYNFVDFCHFS